MGLGDWLGIGASVMGGLQGVNFNNGPQIQQQALDFQAQDVNNLEFTDGGMMNSVTGNTFSSNMPNAAAIAPNIKVDGTTGVGDVASGLGKIFGNEGLWKALQMGIAYKNDAENREIKKKQINHNIKKDQNARDRTKSVKKSLGAGDTLSGSDFSYV